MAKKAKKSNNKKQQSKASRAVACFFSWILCFFIIVSLIAIGSIVTLRGALSEDTLAEATSNFNVYQMTLENEVSGDNIIKTLCDRINPKIVDEYQITPEVVEKVLTESTANEFLEREVRDYADYLLSADGEAEITVDEIMDFIRENEDVVRKNANGYELSEKDYLRIEKSLEDANLEQYSLKSMVGKNDFVDLIFTNMTSVFALIILAWIALLLIIILFATNRFRMGIISSYLGNTLVITSQVFLIAACALLIVKLAVSFTVLQTIALAAAQVLLISFGILLVLGLLFKFISAIIKKVQRKKA